MADDRKERFTGAENLTEPAGKELPGWQGITPRTARRQEELDRQMDEPTSGGIQPPRDSNIDGRNRASAEEALALEEHMADRDAPGSPAYARDDMDTDKDGKRGLGRQ